MTSPPGPPQPYDQAKEPRSWPSRSLVLAVVLQLAGVVLVAVALGLLEVWLALAWLGAVAFVFGLLIERRTPTPTPSDGE